jgi:hypothetical protein
VIGAIALWVIGRRLIHFGVSVMQGGLRRQPIDSMVIGFLGSAVSVTHYWQVYFDTNRVIREAFGEAGFPAPEQLVAVRQSA